MKDYIHRVQVEWNESVQVYCSVTRVWNNQWHAISPQTPCYHSWPQQSYGWRDWHSRLWDSPGAQGHELRVITVMMAAKTASISSHTFGVIFQLSIHSGHNVILYRRVWIFYVFLLVQHGVGSYSCMMGADLLSLQLEMVMVTVISATMKWFTLHCIYV